MILRDIRYLVGIHLSQKGLPPSIVAPTLNILNLLDTELESMGFQSSPELESEVQRLSHSIVLLNAPSSDDEVDEDDYEWEEQDEDEADDDDDIFDDPDDLDEWEDDDEDDF